MPHRLKVLQDGGAIINTVQHALVDDTLTVEAGGIEARCICGWVSSDHFSSMAASVAFQQHKDERSA